MVKKKQVNKQQDNDFLYHLSGILTSLIDELKYSNDSYCLNTGVRKKLITKRDAIVKLIIQKEQREVKKNDNRNKKTQKSRG